jgi:hypothetical protein
MAHGGFRAVRISSCPSPFCRVCFVDCFSIISAFDVGDLQFFSPLEPLRARNAFLRHIAPTRKKDWVVYTKQPLAGPEEVLKYVARYARRVAISNHRLLDINDGKIQFRWKDYRDDNRHKTLTLGADEFIRRFLLHVLPDGFPTYSLFRLSVPAAHANAAAHEHPKSTKTKRLQRAI